MKRVWILLLVLLVALSAFGCGRSSYKQLDVPKELKIDVDTLSEDADNLMPIGDSTPLLAALPEEGLYVYATDQTVVSGVLVKFDGLLQYFPWRFAPRLARPDVYVADYNADGKKDIAFTYVSEAGEHAYRETLHVLLRGDEGFTDNLYTCDKAALESERRLSVLADADKPDTFTAYLGDSTKTFTLPGHGAYAGLYFEEVQDFTLGDKITLRVDPGLVFTDEGQPVFDVITYTADVEFVDNVLTQTNELIEV